jgi:hypothetical protein
LLFYGHELTKEGMGEMQTAQIGLPKTVAEHRMMDGR